MIVTSQASVAGSAVSLGRVPAGPCTVVITNGGGSALFVGAGTTVTVTSGAPVPASAVVPLPGFPSSSPVQLWGITSGGTVTAGLFISTAS